MQDPRFNFAAYFPSTAGKVYTSNDFMDRDTHGFVINTSTSVDYGTHWAAVFVDSKIGKVEYFDSMGTAPARAMKTTVNSILFAARQKWTTINFGNKVLFSKGLLRLTWIGMVLQLQKAKRNRRMWNVCHHFHPIKTLWENISRDCSNAIV